MQKTAIEFKPCGMCNRMCGNTFRCINPDGRMYNKAVHTEDGTCELWTVWQCQNPNGPTPEQIFDWLGLPEESDE